MSSEVLFSGSYLQAPQSQEVINDQLPYDWAIADQFPPDSLNSEGKIALGIRFLEQHGTSRFPFFQRIYRLTQEECKEISLNSKGFIDDIVTWEPLDENSVPQEIRLIRESYPLAIFHLLTNHKENTRTQPIVEIDGKKYYFYSHAFKGPVVDEDYIQKYAVAEGEESRPHFQVLRGGGINVFLMEFHGTDNPEFREPDEIKQIINLIVQFSLCCKGLDMLPCRLAFDNGKLYCVDQKLNYGIYTSTWQAFQTNIHALKGKIEYRCYPEQQELLSLVDQIAADYRITLFLKTIEGKYTAQVPEMIPPKSLNREERLDLTAAVLRTSGTKDLAYMARVYQLSHADKQESMRRAGMDMKDTIVTWDTDIKGDSLELKEEAERAGIRGDYKMFCNRIGNYKSVLTVNVDGQIYVVRKTNPQYVEEYMRRKEREHRPDFLTFPGEREGSVIFLSKFMGVEPINYLNFSHLQMIVDLSDTFAEDERSTIDFNIGNLIVSEERLHYIDKDLTYTEQSNPRLYHFQYILYLIKESLFASDERQVAEQCVKHLIRQKLDLSKSSDYEIFKEIFPFQWLIGLVDAMDLSRSDDRKLLLEIFPILDRMSLSEAESARHYIRIKLDQVTLAGS
ncbi:MAG: hypothetical protein KF898_00805 [Parachlamydiales bacterium]|nr:hypothetical protein [Candidatus Acheromyda pituitae]